MRNVVLLPLLFVASVCYSQSVDVDPLTGASKLNIPLWTVKVGDVSAPVALFYYSNGVRLNVPEGSAGVQWNLLAGGSVNREVRGLPDDFLGANSQDANDPRNGWLYLNNASSVGGFSPSGDTLTATCSDEINDYTALSNFGNNIDTEPDLFSFEAPGLSGQFIFDNNKLLKLMPYQDLDVIVHRDSLAPYFIDKITITTNTGYKYVFGKSNVVTRQAQLKTSTTVVNNNSSLFNYYVNHTTNYATSWHLTQMSSPLGGKITFDYIDGYNTNLEWYSEVNESTNKVDSIYWIRDAGPSSILKTIYGNTDKVTFEWSDGVISNVTITDNISSSTRIFRLEYIDVKSYMNTGHFRKFLTKLSQEVNCVSYPGIQFDYYLLDQTGTNIVTAVFDGRTTQDHYGYYNGVGTSLNPDVYKRTSDTGYGAYRFRLEPATNYALIGSTANRSVDPGKVYFGALKTMTIPTGGYTQIDYESNQYYDAQTNTTLNGGGARVKTIRVTSNDGNPAADIVTKYRYKRTDGQSSGRWIYMPTFAFGSASGVVRTPDNLAPDNGLLYTRVEAIQDGGGKTVYEFLNPGVFPSKTDADFMATVSRVARPTVSCYSLGSYKVGVYGYPFAFNTNYDHERALPDKVTEYAGARIVRQRLYTYQRTSANAVSLPQTVVYGIRKQVSGGFYCWSKYALNSNVNETILTEKERIYDQNDPANAKYAETTKTYEYNVDLVTKITSTQSDGVTTYKKIKYAKNYTATGNDTQSIAINNLNTLKRQGTPVEVMTYVGTNAVNSDITFFDNFGGRWLPSRTETLAKIPGFAESNIAGNVFTYASSNYYPTLYFDSYDAYGNVLMMHDNTRTTSSTIYANKALPALQISNAASSEIVFADFEDHTLSNAPPTGGSIITDSWAGSKAVSLTSISTLTKTGVTKGRGRMYHFSCWAKASGQVQLTPQYNIGAGYVGSAAAIYPASFAGKWYFMDLIVDLSAITTEAFFDFKLVSDGNITLDNVLFYPAAAEIKASAFETLNGKTSEMDSRGNGAFTQFDPLGRPRYTLNMNKDVLKVSDYHLKGSAGTIPVSAFKSTPEDDYFITTNASATFTISSTCTVPNATYAWYVDTTPVGTASSFTYLFTQNKDYIVSLTVTGTTGSSTTTRKIHPRPIYGLTTAIDANELSTYDCNQSSNTRHLTASFTGPLESSSILYHWYQVNSSGIVTDLGTTTTNTYTYTLVTHTNNTLRCVASGTSWNPTTGTHEVVSLTTDLVIQWQNIGNCL
jgi:hypothetical protein